eukprot:gene12829-12957_t
MKQQAAAPQYRWFGLATDGIGVSVERGLIDRLAVYDVETGDYFQRAVTTDTPLLPVFQELVDFVECRVAAIGQTPAIVAHNGFRYHFRALHNQLQQVPEERPSPAQLLRVQDGSNATTCSSRGQQSDHVAPAVADGQSFADRAQAELATASAAAASARATGVFGPDAASLQLAVAGLANAIPSKRSQALEAA